jgi:hypothetical protein
MVRESGDQPRPQRVEPRDARQVGSDGAAQATRAGKVRVMRAVC